MSQIPQAIADKAAAIQAELQRSADAFRSNGDLNQEARFRGIATAYAVADKQMTVLRESWEGDAEQTTTDLRRAAFGSVASSGADAISARDADDRAAQLEDPIEAARLLDRADRNGDDSLARSIAMRAFEELYSAFGDRRWVDVLEAYVETRPRLAPKIDQLLEMQRSADGDRFMNAMWFVVPKPTEVDQMGPTALMAIRASV